MHWLLCLYLVKPTKNQKFARKLLNFIDRAGIPIVPIIVQDSYILTGWVGVIFCRSSMDQNDKCGWFWAKTKRIDSAICHAIKHPKKNKLKISWTVTTALGYYVQNNTKHDMTFNMFAMLNGLIAGEGDDVIRSFHYSWQIQS